MYSGTLKSNGHNSAFTHPVHLIFIFVCLCSLSSSYAKTGVRCSLHLQATKLSLRCGTAKTSPSAICGKDKSELIFHCFEQKGVHRNGVDANAGQRALLQCKDLMEYYDTCTRNAIKNRNL